MKQLFLASLLVVVSACTWVPLEKGGSDVRVASTSAGMGACTFRGEITTTVTNRLAGFERNAIKVADELETMARNEAVGLGANTIQPKSEVIAGEQKFAAYSCR